MKRDHIIFITAAILAILIGLYFDCLPANAEENGVGFDITPHHFGLSVPNLEESIAWYRKMLGFELVTRMKEDAENKMLIALMRRGNFYLELFQVEGAKPMPDYRRDPNADLRVHGLKQMAFQVSDVQAAVKELKAKGVEIAMGPIEGPGVAFVFIRDNSGILIELIQFKKQ